MSVCTLCPRRCAVDRAISRGACHAGEKITLARVGLHAGEEPCLAPRAKSGAVFFSGCALGCVFCQNHEISSSEPFGTEVSAARFEELLLGLQEQGAENLDLVTADHFILQISECLRRVKEHLKIPVVYNCSGYETPKQLKLLEGLVDVYLPDFKFATSSLAARLCRAADYPEVAEQALEEMYRQTGPVTFDGEGKLVRGVLVRHLVLPNHTDDSKAVLDTLSRLFSDKTAIRLSLMRQFTPMPTCTEEDLARPLTTLEYKRVTEYAAALGFCGYVQEKSSVGFEAIPVFDGTGV